MVAPSSLLGRVISEKFIFVSENRGKNSTCLATTPIEGHFVAGFGKKRLFSKKSRKNPDRFQKNSEYTVWKVFFRKRVNISPFFAYIRGGRESESKLFSKKVRFSLIVCRKFLNIRLGQVIRHAEERETELFFEKNAKISDRLPKKSEYTG